MIKAALAKEPSLSDDVARRIVNRVLRQADRIAEIGVALRASDEERPAAVDVEAPQQRVFDPYEIGAVVTLQRLGADGLLNSLSGIRSVEELRSLAAAQNLSIKTDWSNADELRLAIVQGAEQRLADRRAAAS